MSENTIAAPAKGDPITAAWASSVAAAVNGAHGADEAPDSLRTPDGLVSPPPCAEMMEAPPALPMPFDCRVQWEKYGSNSSVFRLYVCLPDVSVWASDASSAWGNASYVYADGRGVAPKTGTSAQGVGTASNAWVNYGTLQAGTVYRLLLYITRIAASGGNPLSGPDAIVRQWKLALVSGASEDVGFTLLAQDCAISPVCVARIYIPSAADISNDAGVCSAESLQAGCVQFHRGTAILARKASVDSDLGGSANGKSSSLDRIDNSSNPEEYPPECFEVAGWNDQAAEASFPVYGEFVMRDATASGNFVKYVRGYNYGHNTPTTIDVVTGVTIDFANETFTLAKKRLTFQNGILTDVTNI